ncbi:GcrA family cell cycle regulator [Bradyrhizobium sp. LHD-71]|uniref:GcrA family cell cycle regulator n=1 Tax=Bradyrhizobium sp. LHD-71 TaxID=3072141 RepID=UPI0028107613|nr:GcrA family cell cycle regulator [Bradyrhizobium sp. LHD-71]MDQ8729448.1 GcrA family cell cycle regulator [Bradyrhizobium sp. LHD-71]
MSLTPSPWTPDRIAELRRLFEAGYSCSQIAREISVSRNAVIGKLSRLGLNRPPGERGPQNRPGPKQTIRRSPFRMLSVVRAGADGKAPVVDDYVDDGQRCSLFELSPQSCRWPIGSPGADDFGFCGNAPAAGLPYCPHHARMAYQPAARRQTGTGGR